MTRYYLLLIGWILCPLMISCQSQPQETKNTEIIVTPSKEAVITLDYLELLFENRAKEDSLLRLLKMNFFNKKFNGVFISEEMIDYNEPKHWIHVNDFGELSSVSFSTADKKYWDDLNKELNTITKGKEFDDKTSDKTLRYLGENYTYETYEPANGINLSTNALYQVFVLNKK